jgi:hypothetical protein
VTDKEIEDLLAEAAKISPEQQRYIDRTNEGETVGSILTPSKWFDVGMKTALSNVRQILTAPVGEKRGET